MRVSRWSPAKRMMLAVVGVLLLLFAVWTLGLFSLTLNDDAALDRAMLEAYKAFRIDAERAWSRTTQERPISFNVPGPTSEFVNAGE